MPLQHDPLQNHLLAALRSEDFGPLADQLELVHLALGESLYESGTQMHHVYLPTDAIVSLLYVMEDGSSAQIAVVGNDGIVGVSLFMGAKPPPAAPWCKVPVTPTASGGRSSRMPSTASPAPTKAPCMICCCATHRRCSR